MNVDLQERTIKKSVANSFSIFATIDEDDEFAYGDFQECAETIISDLKVAVFKAELDLEVLYEKAADREMSAMTGVATDTR